MRKKSSRRGFEYAFVDDSYAVFGPKFNKRFQHIKSDLKRKGYAMVKVRQYVLILTKPNQLQIAQSPMGHKQRDRIIIKASGKPE